MIAIATVLANWKTALMGVLGAIMAGMFVAIKGLSGQKAALKKEVEAHDLGDEIEALQDEKIATVVEDEQDLIIEELQSNAEKSHSDIIDKW